MGLGKYIVLQDRVGVIVGWYLSICAYDVGTHGKHCKGVDGNDCSILTHCLCSPDLHQSRIFVKWVATYFLILGKEKKKKDLVAIIVLSFPSRVTDRHSRVGQQRSKLSYCFYSKLKHRHLLLVHIPQAAATLVTAVYIWMEDIHWKIYIGRM